MTPAKITQPPTKEISKLKLQGRGQKRYQIKDSLIENKHYRILSATDGHQECIIKLGVDSAGNSQILQERDTLQRLLADPKVEPLASAYFPNLIDEVSQREKAQAEIKDKQIFYGKFSHNPKSSGGKSHHGLVFERIPNLYSLEEIKKAYPQGIAAEDIAWILRRLLMALGFAEAAGIVHCAINPANVLIEPDQHGLLLINWTQATSNGEAFQGEAVSQAAPELDQKAEVSPATDIYMAAECMRYLLDHQTPRQIKAFLKGCQQSIPAQRPNDAWELKDEFDNLIEDLWGKRTFHPFEIPTTNKKRKGP